MGGTVGDIEGLPFLEAIRQMRLEEGATRVLFVHITLLPYLRTSGELKTKPTQHSVGRLREIGIQPDIVICRTSVPMGDEERRKISLFCNVAPEAVIEERDVQHSIYEVPLVLHGQGLDRLILRKLRLRPRKRADFTDWRAMLQTIIEPDDTCEIALVGKYVRLVDSYKSIHEALAHGGIANRARVNVRYVEAEDVQKYGPAGLLEGVHGILVPGGFGDRGIEGKVAAAKFAREHKIPYFGICLGMQVAMIEFARNVLGLDGANSSEFDPNTPHPVIHTMKKHAGIRKKGGTMRLGAYPCVLREGTLARRIYGTKLVHERHRHRYEVNPAYWELLQRKGLVFSGFSPDKRRVEYIELPNHPFYLGCQCHPEFKSRPGKPSPVYLGFIKACVERNVKRSAA